MNFTCEIMTLVKTDANRFLLSMSQIDESLVLYMNQCIFREINVSETDSIQQ